MYICQQYFKNKKEYLEVLNDNISFWNKAKIIGHFNYRIKLKVINYSDYDGFSHLEYEIYGKLNTTNEYARISFINEENILEYLTKNNKIFSEKLENFIESNTFEEA